MRSPPDDLTDADVARAVWQHWQLRCTSIQHVPIGAGAYHWQAELDDGTRRWVSVDDLDQKAYIATRPDDVYAVLQGAFDTALALRRRGLEFILAPLPAADGARTQRFGQLFHLGDGLRI